MPKKQAPKQLNAWQQQSARGIVDDTARDRDIDQMIRTSTLPKGLLHLASEGIETDEFIGRIWYDHSERMWKLKQTSKQDGSTTFLSAPSLESLNLSVHLMNALREHAAEYLENDRRVQTGDLGDPELNEVWLWQNFTPHGEEYVSVMCDSARDMMFAEMKRLGYKTVSVEALEAAYVSIVDNPDPARNFSRFFAKRDREGQEAPEARKAAAAKPTPMIADPTANSRLQESQGRQEEARINRQKPLKELRREVIYRTKGNRVPSTGTGRIF
jgi:hypothetical protein